MTDDIASPCVGTCKLDTQSVCIGCGRSIAEIAEWSKAANPRRLVMVENARLRLAAIVQSQGRLQVNPRALS